MKHYKRLKYTITCLRLVAACAVLSLPACSVNPVTGKNELTYLDENWEIATGEKYYAVQQQAGGGSYVLDPDLTGYVASVGQRLAAHSDRPDLPYEFVVINDSTPNAWALPGGKIAIHRGLLTELNDEAELAAVLAHEIVHAAARHSAQGQEVGTLLSVGALAANVLLSNSGANSEAMQQGIAYGSLYGQQRYSRSRESEADLYGMRYMAAAGYDSRAAINLQQTFVRLSQGRQADAFSALFASHPPSQQRVEANAETAKKLPAGGNRGAERFRRAMADLKRREPAYQNGDRAIKALQEKDFKQAIALADKAIAAEKNESLFYEIKGTALMELNRSRDALTALNNAVQLNPRCYGPVLRRGLLRYELQSFQAAEKDLMASIRMAPTQIAFIHLGEIAEAQNNCGAATQYYQQAVAQGTANRENLQQKILALQATCTR